MVKVVQNIHFPVSARSFVVPIVQALNAEHIDTELWVENNPDHHDVLHAIEVPKKLINSDLTLNPVKLIRKVSHYRAALRQSSPSVVHAHQTRAAVVPLLAAYLEQIPVRIYHNHGLPYLGYRGPMRWLLQAIEKLNIRLATHTLLVSRSNLAEAESDGLLPKGSGKNTGRIIKSGSAVGIDLEIYRPEQFNAEAKAIARSHFNISPEAFVLGYVGRPVKRKGFHLLLQAWDRSHLAAQGHVLMIAGCTEKECQQALGNPVDGVRGLGYLNDLIPFYAACDAITLPSEHEGFPYSMLEGAAAGRPLIGTNIPGVRCTIMHNHTGLLIPHQDPQALCSAIQRMANDPALCHQLGGNARARVEAEFSRKIVLSGLLEFYRELNLI